MTLADEVADTLIALEVANDRFTSVRPGERGDRQPVHVVYGGAHLFRRDSAARLGALALASLDAYAPDPFAFARIIDVPGAALLSCDEARAKATYIADPEQLRAEDRSAWLALTVYDRVRDKLEREPVEDFRLDFEDGYGNRPDDE
ncbi:MAG TPA: hypothetical protein VK034_28175, partial [Enhygromyxa sp.]|nr:hypothetical protein [Enhygromyxa sp.]